MANRGHTLPHVLFAANVLLSAAGSQDPCKMLGWPNKTVVNSWEKSGSSEKCFCAYSEMTSSNLTERCPGWQNFVSTDLFTPNKVNYHGDATILGVPQGNSTTRRYGSIIDWSLDLGAGYDQDCGSSNSSCESVGVHFLSIPRSRFFEECCNGDRSLKRMLKVSGGSCIVRQLLTDMIAGALAKVPELTTYKSCRRVNEDPTKKAACLAQCFHIFPEVHMLHLHTTAGVLQMRDGPWDSGLGPDFNSSEPSDESHGHGRYNLCACEPRSWTAPGIKRGFCPTQEPHEAGYVEAAALSLCKNLAGIAKVDESVCEERCREETSAPEQVLSIQV